MKEKELVKQMEKYSEMCELQKALSENAEYEQMMAMKKTQNRLQFVQDLDHQIEFKNLETVN